MYQPHEDQFEDERAEIDAEREAFDAEQKGEAELDAAREIEGPSDQA